MFTALLPLHLKAHYSTRDALSPLKPCNWCADCADTIYSVAVLDYRFNTGLWPLAPAAHSTRPSRPRNPSSREAAPPRREVRSDSLPSSGLPAGLPASPSSNSTEGG